MQTNLKQNITYLVRVLKASKGGAPRASPGAPRASPGAPRAAAGAPRALLSLSLALLSLGLSNSLKKNDDHILDTFVK